VGEILTSHDPVHGFGGGKVMAHGANAAEALNDYRYLPEESALYEPLKSPELDNVKTCLPDITRIVELNGHFPVALDPGYGIDDDPS
jgi:hypothetical protein